MESSFESVLVYLQYHKRKKKRLPGIPHNLLIPRRFKPSNRTLVRHKITRLSRSDSRVVIKKKRVLLLLATAEKGKKKTDYFMIARVSIEH